MPIYFSGNIIGSTFNESSSVAEHKLMALANNARTVIRDLDPSDKLFCVGMRTENKQELILMPGKLQIENVFETIFLVRYSYSIVILVRDHK